MWVITRGHNEYDQCGEYLETVYSQKPTASQVKEYFNCDDEYADFLLQGGGRKFEEYCWYYLTELKDGEPYKNQIQ